MLFCQLGQIEPRASHTDRRQRKICGISVISGINTLTLLFRRISSPSQRTISSISNARSSIFSISLPIIMLSACMFLNAPALMCRTAGNSILPKPLTLRNASIPITSAYLRPSYLCKFIAPKNALSGTSVNRSGFTTSLNSTILKLATLIKALTGKR
jgi:hypothetical protein